MALQKSGGGAFTFSQVTLAELNPSQPGASIQFTGHKYFGGPAVTQTFALTGGAVNPHTFNLVGFNDVVAVTWSQLSPYHQFDNLVVLGTVPASPSTLYATSEFTVFNASNGSPTGTSFGSTAIARVGNSNAGPDSRGMAEFSLSQPELTTATQALLQFDLTNILNGIQFPVRLEAYWANGSADVSDFQTSAATTIATFQPSSPVLGQTFSFDVTGLYNYAINTNQGLGF
ncbi:MAG: hypothetical protein MUF06_13820, partial [Pirellulaceae bacterium]|nr:hypothetical protein [Pirellulaceae bacterium]